MTDNRKSIFLLADSQLLFWNIQGSQLITAIRNDLRTDKSSVVRAAYIGVSNGNRSEFFDLFVAAMNNIDLHETRMISSELGKKDRDFIDSADLILLSGGDCYAGWKQIKSSGLSEIISKKYYSGAVIVGVSAGAVQLGMGMLEPSSDNNITQTLQIVPHYIDVHSENTCWSRLKRTVATQAHFSSGFGISSGGGIIYHPDSVIEPIRSSVHEYRKIDGSNELSSNILLPSELQSFSENAV